MLASYVKWLYCESALVEGTHQPTWLHPANSLAFHTTSHHSDPPVSTESSLPNCALLIRWCLDSYLWVHSSMLALLLFCTPTPCYPVLCDSHSPDPADKRRCSETGVDKECSLAKRFVKVECVDTALWLKGFFCPTQLKWLHSTIDESKSACHRNHRLVDWTKLLHWIALVSRHHIHLQKRQAGGAKRPSLISPPGIRLNAQCTRARDRNNCQERRSRWSE